jgi:hypothetical protein
MVVAVILAHVRMIVAFVSGIACRLGRVRLGVAFERVSGAQSRLPSGLAATSLSNCQGWLNGQKWLNKQKFKLQTTPLGH